MEGGRCAAVCHSLFSMLRLSRNKQNEERATNRTKNGLPTERRTATQQLKRGWATAKGEPAQQLKGHCSTAKGVQQKEEEMVQQILFLFNR